MLSHANLGSNTLTLRDTWGFSADYVLIHALPVFHTHGLFVATHCVLLSGSRILFVKRFDAATALDLIPPATAMMGLPTFVTRPPPKPPLTRPACPGIPLLFSRCAPLFGEPLPAFTCRPGHPNLYSSRSTT